MASGPSNVKKRAKDALGNTEAYANVSNDGKGKKQKVMAMMERWDKMQKGLVTYTVGGTWKNFAKRAGPAENEAAKRGRDPATFTVLPTDPDKHLRIVDSNEVVLAYRLRIPSCFTNTLAQTEHLIPNRKKSSHKRGDTVNRHWAFWIMTGAKDQKPILSRDYRNDLPHSQSWLNENKPMFTFLSDVVLRNLNPRMYSGMRRINNYLGHFDDTAKRPLCCAWFGCAINQFQIKDGTPHMDHNDYQHGFNCVTGWGNWQSCNLALWQIGLKVGMVPGDAVLFLGKILTHNAVDIVGEERHIVDMFTHKNSMIYGQKFGLPIMSAGKGKGKGMGKAKAEEEAYDPDDPVDFEEEDEMKWWNDFVGGS